jgi:AraC-like DNA-binding protein
MHAARRGDPHPVPTRRGVPERAAMTTGPVARHRSAAGTALGSERSRANLERMIVKRARRGALPVERDAAGSHADRNDAAALAGDRSRNPSGPPYPRLSDGGWTPRCGGRGSVCTRTRPKQRDLAEVSGLSMYRLARTFKAETGLAPHACQIQFRVLRTKRLLAAGRPIAVAAEGCGCYDQPHLTGQFKRHVGVTPGGVRARHCRRWRVLRRRARFTVIRPP